jgi:hypothetical protein
VSIAASASSPLGCVSWSSWSAVGVMPGHFIWAGSARRRSPKGACVIPLTGHSVLGELVPAWQVYTDPHEDILRSVTIRSRAARALPAVSGGAGEADGAGAAAAPQGRHRPAIHQPGASPRALALEPPPSLCYPRGLAW